MIYNNKPIASAGQDQNVITGNIIKLDGSESSDADNDPITYSWSFILKPSTSTAALSNISIKNPEFAADVDVFMFLLYQLMMEL
ncbi:hypothetical protein HY745_02625 [Candidatus Desantisbacteria bacterium]|nr:hypothetical protein [Candidatus Desantisbacteria bacterium]